jgi:hypothetical protein
MTSVIARAWILWPTMAEFLVSHRRFLAPRPRAPVQRTSRKAGGVVGAPSLAGSWRGSGSGNGRSRAPASLWQGSAERVGSVGVDTQGLLEQDRLALHTVRVRNAALDRAHAEALLLGVEADTLAAQRGVDDELQRSTGDPMARTHTDAEPAVDAFVANQCRHGVESPVEPRKRETARFQLYAPSVYSAAPVAHDLCHMGRECRPKGRDRARQRFLCMDELCRGGDRIAVTRPGNARRVGRVDLPP